MNPLILAVQKSGRLARKTQALLQESGFSFQNGGGATLRSPATNYPLELLFLRDDDIPECVASGVAHLGVVGQNVLQETGSDTPTLLELGFGRCRLSLAVPRDTGVEGPQDLDGCTIATSYPRQLQRWLEAEGVRASIRPFHGSTEITPSVGMADAICDLVSTGSTLASNGLRELTTLAESQAVLIGNNDRAGLETQIDDIVFRLRSVIQANGMRYVLLNCPNDSVDAVSRILPGVKSPTVMPLALDGWSSVHTVIREDDFWSRIEDLKNSGAEGILVLPIEKMVV